MEDLLPYYERELNFLRSSSRDFAQRYPKIASRLGLSAENSEDPHVERMIESFALLGARINKKLDDDYPEFTEALFEVLYPHYLRPFPSCSVACFDAGQVAAQLTAPARIPRGTELKSHPVRGVACRFRTVYDVTLLPLAITEVSYVSSASAPAGNLPAGMTGRLSIRLECLGEAMNFAALPASKVRVYLHGEPSFVAALRDCLFLRTAAAYVESRPGRWEAVAGMPISEVGLADDEALIDYPARSHPAYRLLAEHFVFAEKFNFVDIDLQSLRGAVGAARAFTLHLAVRGVRADSNTARLLESVGTDNLRLGCTPVVNLFKQRADPIRVTHMAASYPVVADARRAYGYDIYAIDRVRQVRQGAQGESVVEFRPFYSLQHGDTPEGAGHYWTARRDELVAQRSPGYETEISLVDIDFDPSVPQVETLSIDLTCTNRDLPAQLAAGQPGGDLFLEGGTVARAIRMLRRPTHSHRFPQGHAAHWRLISHLALNHLSLVQSGLPALKETLRLYDLSHSAVAARQIEGLVGLDYRPATHWMAGEPFATFVRGIEIRLTLNEDNFVGTSLHAFVAVMNRFFGLYVHANSFVQLVVLSRRNSDELLRCPPCNGDAILA
ncbi:type VI secretion system baseplate subunit TssF [Achromobacter aloeverae]|uniref:Type VI secretion system baseplate subunit TssF n=1 Tax=Achromobacter aloeverae TaxID=1750518 RepID=A0A4V1MRU1_9BURK|nr:type VI secretion system baseplate subunit TssF [Achromobacter aloeverae]RXN86231.1 type VI secretion system baseplate subunit TssF [Achromobacter aloeverae]